ncbi:PadR family transcriptional regulator [Sphaerisporangium album]|uniref:PadR family transcriptional regulator n=1 Tax=Sphaerisporangium album TaxID=509200 RepID=A0A367FNV8_9ACTN|nr:helix-turn-helix transcriptional regulator [Sphaerisporangium album]RCG31924.1 PadR family transcriptional regulator [Sphaerisporangium album]
MRRHTLDGIRATRAMRRVLLVLLTDAANLGGFTITKAAGVGAGSTYVCLDRLEERAWVTGEFADGPYPRRRFYRLTPAGWKYSHQLLGLIPSEVRRG